MKKKMTIVYRKSSARTGREYDERMILVDQMPYYLKRGWYEGIPGGLDTLKNDYIQPSELTPLLKSKIQEANGKLRAIAKKFNVSYATAQKIRSGKL